jgi:hypothetical protein
MSCNGTAENRDAVLVGALFLAFWSATAVAQVSTDMSPDEKTGAANNCGTLNGTVITHTTNITSDTTWAGAGTVHIVATSISVLAPATLTIAQCAVVKLKAGVELSVQGSATERPDTGPTLITLGDVGQSPNKNAALVALGTAASPVTFTSGNAGPSPGDWAGIWLATSVGSKLNHVVIEDVGGDAHIGPTSCGPVGSRHTAALLVGDNDPLQYVPPASLIKNSQFI